MKNPYPLVDDPLSPVLRVAMPRAAHENVHCPPLSLTNVRRTGPAGHQLAEAFAQAAVWLQALAEA